MRSPRLLACCLCLLACESHTQRPQPAPSLRASYRFPRLRGGPVALEVTTALSGNQGTEAVAKTRTLLLAKLADAQVAVADDAPLKLQISIEGWGASRESAGWSDCVRLVHRLVRDGQTFAAIDQVADSCTARNTPNGSAKDPLSPLWAVAGLAGNDTALQAGFDAALLALLDQLDR
jgi:hypothetical protein